MSEDPLERNDVSNLYPKIVNKFLVKLADYYVSIIVLLFRMGKSKTRPKGQKAKKEERPEERPEGFFRKES